MFYAHSTSKVISKQDTFCHHTINVKNVYKLKLEHSQILKIILKKWLEYKHTTVFKAAPLTTDPQFQWCNLKQHRHR